MMRQEDAHGVVACSAAGGGSGSTAARLIGGASAGVSEILIFHSVDTVAKRLMFSKENVRGATFAETMAKSNAVVFREAANEPFFTKFRSLYPGLGFAAAYKVSQRVYKFGGQPIVRDFINKNYGKGLQDSFGERVGKTLSSAVAGSLMGIGEVALLPLDVLKIKSQTAPETLKGRGVVDLFQKEGLGLYRGAGWTVLRNAPGSFALFGGSAVVHYGIFGLTNTKDATVFQNFVASIVGAVTSITVASPVDVIKTRIQSRPFDSPETGMQIIRNALREEGFTAFFKGLTPKILVVGPKLIFSFTVAQSVMNFFERRL
ncbi:Mitochondrial GTP/GDP carrier protein 1 [Hondaea fermentalgiana]|uniref:Mitochondrial GTP/GDP carrier protein 1 n=1 Tax=Hondaea fermentalgiana TaxID=2315210 RepID=A0A2R5GNS0_9STRA|nr:Mitochondrial GTP/GDP carrier protein 1 [Hondaea fermentalgiana]|eukprot:GBG29951.1 Mitochondrial GTP/GDP carrier protein 1 [Hondaea fermentalgiana]